MTCSPGLQCASCVYDLGVNYVLSVHYVCLRFAFGVHRFITNLKPYIQPNIKPSYWHVKAYLIEEQQNLAIY